MFDFLEIFKDKWVDLEFHPLLVIYSTHSVKSGLSSVYTIHALWHYSSWALCPEVDSSIPPAAFQKRSKLKTNKRQLSAIPPGEDVKDMWAYRHLLASGLNTNGVTENPPLHKRQFLAFSRVNLNHYVHTTVYTFKSSRVPDSFMNLAGEKTPVTVNVSMNQHQFKKKVSRQSVQVLKHVVLRALAELLG